MKLTKDQEVYLKNARQYFERCLKKDNKEELAYQEGRLTGALIMAGWSGVEVFREINNIKEKVLKEEI